MNKLIIIAYSLIAFVQIICESLPISSSGHVEFIKDIFNIDFSIYFDHLLHGPTILVILFFYYKKLVPIILNYRRYLKIIKKLFFLGFVADLMTLFFYIGFNIFNVYKIPYYIGFFITGLALLSLIFCKRTGNKWNWKISVMLGIAQGISLIPGISRLAITLVVARWAGIKRNRAFEISILLLFPLICAGFLRGIFGFYDDLNIFWDNRFIATIIVATIISYFMFKFTYKIFYKGKIYYFGIYLLLLSLFSFLFI